jgi:hypothetical protein
MKNKNMENELNTYLAIGDQLFIDKKIRVAEDKGTISGNVIRLFEKFFNVKLPRLYTRFIVQHNGADIENCYFDYGNTKGSIRFTEFGKVIDYTEYIKYSDDKEFYPGNLVPFGDDGGEGVIFFSYDTDCPDDNPKIVLIAEGEKEDVANSFEDFINLLYVDQELIYEQLEYIESEVSVTLPNSYREFCVNYCTKSFNKKFLFGWERFTFLFPSTILGNISKWNKRRFKDLIPFCSDEEKNLICFDFKNPDTNKQPKIVRHIINYPDEIKTSFVANNFEEFVNVLHESEDEG